MEEFDAFFLNSNAIYADFDLIDNTRHLAYKRYHYYWPYVMYSMDYKKSWVRYFNLLAVAIQMIIPLPYKRTIGSFQDIYWGFVWGSYPKDSIEYIVKHLKNNPQFLLDLKSCKIPEELCFQTILQNSEFKSRMINNNLRYWNFEGGDGSGPIYLKMEDLSNIESSVAFFARKIKYDSRIRTILENRYLLAKEKLGK